MGGMSRRVPLVAVASLLLIAVACSTSNDETLKSTAGASAGATTTSVEPTTTVELPTTLAEPTTTSEPTGASEPLTALPGEPVDWFVEGTVAQVAGVAFDETFVIRTLPGEDQPVAAMLPSLTELVLTGNGRDLDQGTFSIAWAEVTAGGVTGWISQWSFVYLGAPRDVTAEAVTAFGHLPTAPTMLELGTIVIAELAPLDPDSAGAKIVHRDRAERGSHLRSCVRRVPRREVRGRRGRRQQIPGHRPTGTRQRPADGRVRELARIRACLSRGEKPVHPRGVLRLLCVNSGDLRREYSSHSYRGFVP